MRAFRLGFVFGFLSTLIYAAAAHAGVELEVRYLQEFESPLPMRMLHAKDSKRNHELKVLSSRESGQQEELRKAIHGNLCLNDAAVSLVSSKEKLEALLDAELEKQLGSKEIAVTRGDDFDKIRDQLVAQAKAGWRATLSYRKTAKVFSRDYFRTDARACLELAHPMVKAKTDFCRAVLGGFHFETLHIESSRTADDIAKNGGPSFPFERFDSEKIPSPNDYWTGADFAIFRKAADRAESRYANSLPVSACAVDETKLLAAAAAAAQAVKQAIIELLGREHLALAQRERMNARVKFDMNVLTAPASSLKPAH